MAITGFVSKLAPDGSHLVYSTYLGGSENDAISGLAHRRRGQRLRDGRDAVDGLSDHHRRPAGARREPVLPVAVHRRLRHQDRRERVGARLLDVSLRRARRRRLGDRGRRRRQRLRRRARRTRCTSRSSTRSRRFPRGTRRVRRQARSGRHAARLLLVLGGSHSGEQPADRLGSGPPASRSMRPATRTSRATRSRTISRPRRTPSSRPSATASATSSARPCGDAFVTEIAPDGPRAALAGQPGRRPRRGRTWRHVDRGLGGHPDAQRGRSPPPLHARLEGRLPRRDRGLVADDRRGRRRAGPHLSRYARSRMVRPPALQRRCDLSPADNGRAERADPRRRRAGDHGRRSGDRGLRGRGAPVRRRRRVHRRQLCARDGVRVDAGVGGRQRGVHVQAPRARRVRGPFPPGSPAVASVPAASSPTQVGASRPQRKRLRKGMATLGGSIGAVTKARRKGKISSACAGALEAELRDAMERAQRVLLTLGSPRR